MPTNLLKKYPDLLDIIHLPNSQRNDSLMRIFKRDIENNLNFQLFKKPIFPVKKSGQPTMLTLFNHLINKEDVSSTIKKRNVFDPDRSQRLHWFRHHIENNNKIEVFSFKDRINGQDIIRTYLFDTEQRYIIILEPRKEGIELY